MKDQFVRNTLTIINKCYEYSEKLKEEGKEFSFIFMFEDPVHSTEESNKSKTAGKLLTAGGGALLKKFVDSDMYDQENNMHLAKTSKNLTQKGTFSHSKKFIEDKETIIKLRKENQPAAAPPHPGAGPGGVQGVEVIQPVVGPPATEDPGQLPSHSAGEKAKKRKRSHTNRRKHRKGGKKSKKTLISSDSESSSDSSGQDNKKKRKHKKTCPVYLGSCGGGKEGRLTFKSPCLDSKTEFQLLREEAEFQLQTD